MQKIEFFQMLTFSYMNLISIFTSVWWIIILPQILSENFQITKSKEKILFASLFYTSFYSGLILSYFFWPKMKNLTSNRNLVLFSFIVQTVFSIILGLFNNFYWIIFCRFFCGLMYNYNSIGKDFVLEFSKDIFVKYIYSLIGCLNILISYIGPFIGYLIYDFSDQSFLYANYYIGISFLIGLFFFILCFYSNLKKKNEKKLKIEEETENLLKKKVIDKSFKKGQNKNLIKNSGKVFSYYMKIPFLRGLIIIYVIYKGIFEAITLLTIFFLEEIYNQGGLGISNKNLSIIFMISYLPSILILIISSKIIPKKIDYINFIRIITLILSFSILMFPLMRYSFSENFIKWNKWIIFFNFILLNMLNSRLLSPFILLQIKSRLLKEDRYILDSIIFVLSMISSIFFVSTTAWFYDFLYFRSYNKCFSFLFLSSFLWIAICFTKKPPKKLFFI